jgi:hypothetical protein
MNGKQFLLALVALAVLVAGGWAVFNWKRASYEVADSRVGQKLLPGFKVDEVGEIVIVEPAGTATLVRADRGWTVRERGGYPADVEAIRDLLLKLEAAKVVQAEGLTDAFRSRLQLAAPGSGAKPEETGTVLELKARDGKSLARLVLGRKTTKQANMPGLPVDSVPSGRYVLVTADPQRANVVAEPLTAVAAKPQQWLARDYLRIERIRSIDVLGPDGKERWSVNRPDEASGWRWSAPGKLDGGKAQDAASALYSMRIDDAATSDADAGLDQPVTVRAQTFDGWSYELRIGKPAPEDRYHVKASVTGTVPDKRTPRPDEKAEDKEKEDKAFAERQATLKAKLEREQALGAYTVLVAKSGVEPLLRERSALVAVEKKDEQKDGKKGDRKAAARK